MCVCERWSLCVCLCLCVCVCTCVCVWLCLCVCVFVCLDEQLYLSVIIGLSDSTHFLSPQEVTSVICQLFFISILVSALGMGQSVVGPDEPRPIIQSSSGPENILHPTMMFCLSHTHTHAHARTHTHRWLL